MTGKPYGLVAVCLVWRLAQSGVFRHPAPPSNTPPERWGGPLRPMSDAARSAALRGVLATSPFHGERHRKA